MKIEGSAADRFWAWFNDFTEPFKPVMEGLSKEFGAEFAMQHTGGGCMAIEADLEGGYHVMITDADDVLGYWDQRQPDTGYAVGVYLLEACDCWVKTGVAWKDGCDHPAYPGQDAVGWASSPAVNTTPQLIKLIRLALASVNHREPGAACTGYMGHIDPALLEEIK